MLEQILALLMALAVLAFGAFAGTQAFLMLRGQLFAWLGARDSRSWPVTSGTVEENRLAWAGTRAPRAKPVVSYRYQVGGKSYLGQRIDFSFAPIYFTDQAQAILARYPQGAAVAVYYDPQNPAESTLEQHHRGVGQGAVVALVLLLPTCLCLATGLTMLAQAFAR
jgi:hypothetical protein